MIILGFDPGTEVTGYGIICNDDIIDFGCFRTNRKDKLSDRYLALFSASKALIAKYKPDAVSIETQFMGKNAQSAIKLGMARASLILPAKIENIPVFEYSPTKVKLAATGQGNATKEQVQRMIQSLYGLDEMPQPEDAADALACAIAHQHMHRYQSALAGEF